MKNTRRISKCCSNGIPFLLMFLFVAALWFSNAHAAESEVTDQNIKRAVLLHLLLGNPKALAAIGSRPKSYRGAAERNDARGALRSRPKDTVDAESNESIDARRGSDDDRGPAKTTTGAPPSPADAAPAIPAGVPQIADAGTAIHLDGAASSDPDGDQVSFQWSRGGGSVPIYLRNAELGTPSFVVPDSAATNTISTGLMMADFLLGRL